MLPFRQRGAAGVQLRQGTSSFHTWNVCEAGMVMLVLPCGLSFLTDSDLTAEEQPKLQAQRGKGFKGNSVARAHRAEKMAVHSLGPPESMRVLTLTS